MRHPSTSVALLAGSDIIQRPSTKRTVRVAYAAVKVGVKVGDKGGARETVTFNRVYRICRRACPSLQSRSLRHSHKRPPPRRGNPISDAIRERGAAPSEISPNPRNRCRNLTTPSTDRTGSHVRPDPRACRGRELRVLFHRAWREVALRGRSVREECEDEGRDRQGAE